MALWGAFDVGSNTVRVLLAEIKDGILTPLFRGQEITRLAGGFKEGGGLGPEAISRTVNGLKRLSDEARSRGMRDYRAVTTEIVRRAPNAKVFIDTIRKEAGLELEVIPPEEEASLAVRGVLSVMPAAVSYQLILDIGGASTEFILTHENKKIFIVSRPLGVVTLTERFLKSDPPVVPEMELLERFLKDELKPVVDSFIRHNLDAKSLATQGKLELIGTAGTITSLAAVNLSLAVYQPERINGHRLTFTRVGELMDLFKSLPISKRREIVGLEPKRGEVILAGSIFMYNIMETLGVLELTVSDSGLLEGIILERAAA